MAATATVGLQLEFDPKFHDWNVHLNRLEQFFIANAITDDSIKRAILLNGLVQEAYIFLQNLGLPTKPSDANFIQRTNFLTKVCKIGL